MHKMERFKLVTFHLEGLIQHLNAITLEDLDDRLNWPVAQFHTRPGEVTETTGIGEGSERYLEAIRAIRSFKRTVSGIGNFAKVGDQEAS